MELSQQCRDAVANDPGVEAHADAPEGLGSHAVNDPHAEGDADEEARENVANQADALGRKHAGEVVRDGGERRLGESHEPEPGSEALLGEPLGAKNESQGGAGGGGWGDPPRKPPTQPPSDGALG